MMSRLMAFVALGVAAAAWAEPPFQGPTLYATRRVEPVKIDGDLSEWAGVKAVTMDQEKYFFAGQGMSAAKWKGPRDLSARFQVQWDEQFLYFAAEVTDDAVTEPHGSLAPGVDTGSWDDDGVELMLDNDGCGMPRYFIGDPMHHEFHFVYSAKHPLVFDNFWKLQPGAPAPEFTLPDGSKEPLAYPGEVMEKNEVTPRFGAPPYNGAFAFRRTAKGYNLELRMSLPGATMRAINDGGHPIGFDVAINDNDLGSGALKQQLHWSQINGLFWRNCQLFGTLILLKD
jgi:hypothetical protein